MVTFQSKLFQKCKRNSTFEAKLIEAANIDYIETPCSLATLYCTADNKCRQHAPFLYGTVTN